jgi:hypothetical protein
MPYGKIHDSIFDSSIMEENIDTRYVWFCFITVADKNGIVDATIPALSRKFNMSNERLEKAIKCLSEPDLSSRTPDDDGRRIKPIRNTFGWQIINYEHYRDIRNYNDRQEYLKNYMKGYMRKRRKTKEKEGVKPDVKQVKPVYANTDTDTDKDKEFSKTIELTDPFLIILANKTTFKIPKEKILEYQKVYPEVNVINELKRLIQWNKDNPDRRKTRRGIFKHINSWLSRSQERKEKVAEELSKGKGLQNQQKMWKDVKKEIE